ncbi:MAG: hypothetical protein ACK4RV_02665 [Caulobacter sp.]
MLFDFAAIGAVIASLFLILRTGPGLLRARATGVLIGKGHARPRIERSLEPERFDSLWSQRARTLIAPTVVLACAVVFLLLEAWALKSYFDGFRRVAPSHPTAPAVEAATVQGPPAQAVTGSPQQSRA